MTAVTVAGTTRHPNGQVELADPAAAAGRYANPELVPVPVAKRTWTTYNYVAIWMGMAHNIPSYLLASGLIVLGMSWLQAFLTITIANVLVLVPMLLNSHAGTKYGIPFPVFARAFYGLRGANLAALLRAIVACGWFGIQTWVGGQAIYTIIGRLAGHGWTAAASWGGQPWTMWVSFAAFWLVQIALIWRGINALRRFENWAAPLVTVAFTALLVYMLVKAGGIGPILRSNGSLGWGSKFWPVFWPSLMAMIAFWATLSLNMPDFTRFSRGQKQQVWGQILGLPTTMSYISIVSIIVTSAAVVVYHQTIWDPVALTTKFSSTAIVIIGLIMVILATMSVNVAANVVSPSYDFSNAAPRLVSFRTGGLITGVIGVAIQPWRLLTDPHVYIYTWLGFYGGILGTVAGVLIAGYWVRSRTSLSLRSLFTRGGPYWFAAGWNWRAVVATLAGAVLAVGGAYTAAGTDGPFPAAGLIPVFKPLYDYSWVVGLAVGFVLYLVLSLPVFGRAAEAGVERATATAAAELRSGFMSTHMDSAALRTVQQPLKDTYRSDPGKAVITLRADGTLGEESVSCSVATGQALTEAGLHPATGGDGSLACSGDMLLQALVACAGVTLRAVATSLEIPVSGGTVTAEGDLDFRGTLAVSKEAPVGFTSIRLSFVLDTSASADQLETLLKLTERYCVVYQTLARPAALSVSASQAPG